MMTPRSLSDATFIYYFTVLTFSLNFSLVTHCWGGVCTLFSVYCTVYTVLIEVSGWCSYI